MDLMIAGVEKSHGTISNAAFKTRRTISQYNIDMLPSLLMYSL